jgi:hypothetical protein
MHRARRITQKNIYAFYANTLVCKIIVRFKILKSLNLLYFYKVQGSNGSFDSMSYFLRPKGLRDFSSTVKMMAQRIGALPPSQTARPISGLPSRFRSSSYLSALIGTKKGSNQSRSKSVQNVRSHRYLPVRARRDISQQAASLRACFKTSFQPSANVKAPFIIRSRLAIAGEENELTMAK